MLVYLGVAMTDDWLPGNDFFLLRKEWHELEGSVRIDIGKELDSLHGALAPEIEHVLTDWAKECGWYIKLGAVSSPMTTASRHRSEPPSS